MGSDEVTTDLGSLAELLRRVATTPGTRSLAPGAVIGGRYTVDRFLGRGGMGAVYAVRDAELDDLVALKLLHAELGADRGYQQRLRAEVRLARRVSHPNVCRVHDIGQDDGRLFVTMELVRGQSLRQWLRDRDGAQAPGFPIAIDLVVQVCAALTAAHRAGVLHRDVKPDNVVVETSRAVLTDFGVASLAYDREQVVAGTPGYIAPEVLRGEPFDLRADVYSTAVLAYELTTGATPFGARTLDACRELALERRPAPGLPEAIGPAVLRVALDAVFARALDPDPARRIATPAELAEAIAHAARGVAPAAPPPPPRRAELRVATALVYRTAAAAAGGPMTDAGEDLERIVVDRGGTAIAVGALEITALFGVPLALGDDAERAARAAQALVAHAGGRAGLDTVRVVLRPGAAPLADAEALAAVAALVQAAPSGAVVATAVTARQLAPRFDLAPVLVGEGTARRVIGPRPAAPGGRAATFRDHELRALTALAEDCFTHRRPRHGEVRAPAGYGKTQLRDAMIARLRERREIEWLVAQAAPSVDTGPLGLLRLADPEWYAAATRDGLADRTAVFAAARRWIEARAERCPVCVVVDDLQWADPLSRELIADLVGALDDVPVFVATFVRISDDSDAVATVPGVDAFTLGAIDPRAATELVRELAPGAAPETIADVVRRAAGNPFFLEELAREVAERGPARGRAPTLPKTVEAVVQARLDHLEPATRELLTTAAVIGPVFSYDALAALGGAQTDVDRDDLDARLAELERSGLIAPVPLGSADADAERYRFVHDLVRDVTYARNSASERRAAHATMAAWLARRHPTLAGLTGADPSSAHELEVEVEVISAYAHHLAAADEDVAAARAFRVAGLRYLEASAYHDAAEALRRSAALAPSVDADLALALGDAVLQAESIAAAEAWYRRALGSMAADDHGRRALAWHKLGTAATRGADNAAAVAAFEAGLALVAPDGEHLAPWAALDPRVAAGLYGSYGWVAGYMLGDTARGLPACRRAVALLDGTPYRRELAQALSRLGAALMRANRFAEQLECNRRNLAIGIELGDGRLQMTARINLGVALGVIGEIDEAIAHTELARGLAAQIAARSAAGLIESNLAGLYLETGRLDDAERCLDEGLVLAERAGARAGLTETYGFAARLRAARGDLAGAEHWARQSLTLADSQGLRLDQGIALRLLAQIEARNGDLVAARASIDASAARLVGVDGYEQARTAAAHARICTRAGDPGAAAARAHAESELTRFGARRKLAVLDVLDEVR